MNRVQLFGLSAVVFVQMSAVSADPTPAPSASTKNTLYSYIVTGQVSSGGWEPCITTGAPGDACYSENFDINSVPVTVTVGNRTTLTSKQVRTGYSVEVKDNIVTASCADELHGKTRFAVQGKVGEKIKVRDICEVIVVAGPLPEITIK